MITKLIEKELDNFIRSIEDLKPELHKFYSGIVDDYSKIADQLIKYPEFKYLDDEELSKFEIRRIFLEKSNEQTKNFFTITSKNSFSNLPVKIVNLDWGKSLIYTPLNDHSRQYLQKGDVLFCYRQGQFDSLNDALDIRGIYGIGIAASKPLELFPDKDKHNKWGILISFPLQLPKHLDLRNIQMHPQTIDLTPYNGNRNDALQYIPNETHYSTLMNLIYSKNPEIQKYFKILFPDFNFNEVVLPNDALGDIYSKKSISLINENVLINAFVEWSNKEENYHKSYDGLVTYPVLKFWDTTYFNNKLFRLDISDLNESYKKIESIIINLNNKEWDQYSFNTNRNAPDAILGKNNYLKFLKEFIGDESKIKNYIDYISLPNNIDQNLFECKVLWEYLTKTNLFFWKK